VPGSERAVAEFLDAMLDDHREVLVAAKMASQGHFAPMPAFFEFDPHLARFVGTEWKKRRSTAPVDLVLCFDPLPVRAVHRRVGVRFVE
jgi:hypothetical protein